MTSNGAKAVGWYRHFVVALQIATFTFGSVILVVPPAMVGLPYGWDAVVYSHGARALLEGGDPWLTRGYAIDLGGAPPPTLLVYLPFAFLPDSVVSIVWIAIGAGSAVYSLRRLGLPAWWLLFPPLALGIAGGTSAPLVLALLVRGGVMTDAAAVLIRAYAAIPLLLLGRLRSVVWAVIVVVLTAPFLAWFTYIADREYIAEVYARQIPGGYAASTVLIPLAVFGLIALGRRRAAWLIVPALWPHSQPYYATIAMPIIAEVPLVALSLALPVPGLVAFGLAGEAIATKLSSVAHLRKRTPDPAEDRERV